MSEIPAARSARACQECNRKKSRCDKQRPVCGLCQRTGAVCDFPSKRRIPLFRKAAPERTKSQKINDNLGRLLNLLDSISEPAENLVIPRRTSSVIEAPESTDQIGQQDRQLLREDTTVESERNPVDMPLETSPAPPSNNPSLVMQKSIYPTERRDAAKDALQFDEISGELALHLIDLYFVHVQPWLPLLHKPSFLSHYTTQQRDGRYALDNLLIEERLILLCVFALAARYSNSTALVNIEPLSRGERFGKMAKAMYDQARNLESPSLPYLQGCILLSVYCYTSGLSTQGWIAVGVCVRLAYELELSEMDYDDEDGGSEHIDCQNGYLSASWKKEEKRRAWWLVWELDTFGSILSRRPFAIDRRRMKVMLPISDDDWVSGRNTPSSILKSNVGEAWKSIDGTVNQDARAWFLVANHMVGCIHELIQRREGISETDMLLLNNDLSCFKLSLPSSLDLNSVQPVLGAEPSARDNWVLGMHLMLSTAFFMLSNAVVKKEHSQSPVSTRLHTSDASDTRIRDISSIASRWSASQIQIAHPFLVCMLLPVYFRSSCTASPAVLSSHHDLIGLVLRTFAQYWGLGRSMLSKATVFKVLDSKY